MWNIKHYIKLNKLILINLIACVGLVCTLEPSGMKQNDEQFKRLFKMRRAEQLDAVKSMRKLHPDKQQKMVETVTKTVFDVILKSRSVLENSQYIPGVSEFPETEEHRDALSNILENTALIGEIILRLPDIAEPVLRSSNEWLVLLTWSLTFGDQTGLLDNSTTTLFNLVGQELNLIRRSSKYVNPYRKTKNFLNSKPKDSGQVMKKRKKTESPRGPRLSLPQLGEL